MLRRFLAAGAVLLLAGTVAGAFEPQLQQGQEKVRLVEPRLTIARGGVSSPQVALTLDACMGKTDRRILDMLVREKIPATIFVTARWLRQNGEAFAILKANADLFAIEDHGAMHVPAATNVPRIYGIRTAGSLAAVRAEIEGGAKAIMDAGAPKPKWYRDATARYSTDAIDLATSLGYGIGGYSLNGDQGASLLAPVVARRISGARDGDVIISHINQPSRSAGDGVVKGVLALKAKGMKFVLLRDVETTLTLNPVPTHKLPSGIGEAGAGTARPRDKK
ncbi:polysaccharide deacetylase family protein [Brucella sp. BE17]|uniref:polysaccharide deacetylase family protein n=1 Tax=Brucella sp. BE17 TaxID=3142977 RepID=UPI0031BA8B11